MRNRNRGVRVVVASVIAVGLLMPSAADARELDDVPELETPAADEAVGATPSATPDSMRW